MRKVLGNWIQQFTCPNCGGIGAGSPAYRPRCHRCNYLIKMRPSHNGVILSNWEEVQEQNEQTLRQERIMAGEEKPNPKIKKPRLGRVLFHALACHTEMAKQLGYWEEREDHASELPKAAAAKSFAEAEERLLVRLAAMELDARKWRAFVKSYDDISKKRTS